ncbi:MAG: hypothetical protein HRT51_18700 [Colwellia sp.]|nr:hypothetical protein [Colwellia sp.]
MTSLKYGTGNDPYCYDNTDVLINKLDINEANINSVHCDYSLLEAIFARCITE